MIVIDLSGPSQKEIKIIVSVYQRYYLMYLPIVDYVINTPVNDVTNIQPHQWIITCDQNKKKEQAYKCLVDLYHLGSGVWITNGSGQSFVTIF